MWSLRSGIDVKDKLDKANKRWELLKGFIGWDLFIVCASSFPEFKLIDAYRVFIINTNNNKILSILKQNILFTKF